MGTPHTRRATNTHNTGNHPLNPRETSHHHPCGRRAPARSGWEPQPGRPSARSGEGPHTTTTSGPQPGVAKNRTRGPQPGVAREHPLPPTADQSQEWRGTAPRTLSQEWRGASNHHQRRTPARSGGQPHLATPHKPADLSQEWQTTTPPAPPADPSQEWRGTAPWTLSQERRGTIHHHRQRAPAGSGGDAHTSTSARSGEGPPPPSPASPPHPSQEWRRTHHRGQHSGRGGTGRKEPTGDAGEGPSLRGWEPPPVTVSAPPEHTQ